MKKLTIFLGIIITASIVVLTFKDTKPDDTKDFRLNNLKVGISFPPVSDDEQRNFTREHLDDLGITKIRFAEDWALREKTQGKIQWATLDERIKWAEDNHYEVMLTIQSNGPAWACSSVKNDKSCVFTDNNDFKNYIDQLLQRYAGKISKIQFGNEWQSDHWYAGSAEDFIVANNILYTSTKTYSPATKVILGGFTTSSLRFLAGCNDAVASFHDDDGSYHEKKLLKKECAEPSMKKSKIKITKILRDAKYDMVDLHFYDDEDQWDEYYINFLALANKPIIVSEFGGPNMHYEKYSDARQSKKLYQYIKKLDELGIKEAYFFKLVEGTANPAHTTSGLIDEKTLTNKPSYKIFKSFSNPTKE